MGDFIAAEKWRNRSQCRFWSDSRKPKKPNIRWVEGLGGEGLTKWDESIRRRKDNKKAMRPFIKLL